jgi:hypothetical protein
LNNFEPIAFGDQGLIPGGAEDDLTVPLDGDAVALEAEGLDQPGKLHRRHQVCEGVGLAVELDGEWG